MAALSGLRIVSLALNVPGPVAVARLVAEGASALKVEPPSGDPLAVYSRPWYDALHAGVEVVALDLRTGSGRAALEERLTEADVLVTSHRPASLARLGLAAVEVARWHPALRQVAIVGDRARPDEAGHDLTYQAGAGLVGTALPPTLLADMAGAERTVAAVLLVLREPPGTCRVVGLRDVVDDMALPRRVGLTAPGGRLGGADPAYQVYAVRDGHVAVAALEPHFRTRLYEALGAAPAAPLAETLAARTCAECEALARAHDVPLAVYFPASAPRR